jgi:hypothetical protein
MNNKERTANKQFGKMADSVFIPSFVYFLYLCASLNISAAFPPLRQAAETLYAILKATF